MRTRLDHFVQHERLRGWPRLRALIDADEVLAVNGPSFEQAVSRAFERLNGKGFYSTNEICKALRRLGLQQVPIDGGNRNHGRKAWHAPQLNQLLLEAHEACVMHQAAIAQEIADDKALHDWIKNASIG